MPFNFWQVTLLANKILRFSCQNKITNTKSTEFVYQCILKKKINYEDKEESQHSDAMGGGGEEKIF